MKTITFEENVAFHMACPALVHLALEAKTPSKADFLNAAYIKRLILGTRLSPRGAPTIGNNTSYHIFNKLLTESIEASTQAPWGQPQHPLP